MGASKTSAFSDAQNQIANLMKAMAHPARVAIMEHLIKTGACVCGDIVDELPLAQPTVSQHLKELKNAQLIKGSIEGTAICYCVNEQTIDKLMQYCLDLKSKFQQNKCC